MVMISKKQLYEILCRSCPFSPRLKIPNWDFKEVMIEFSSLVLASSSKILFFPAHDKNDVISIYIQSTPQQMGIFAWDFL